MKRILLFLIILSYLNIWADDTGDLLWQKAVIIAKENSHLITGELEQVTKLTNKKGKVKVEETILITYSQSGNDVVGRFESSCSNGGKPVGQDDERIKSMLEEDMLNKEALFLNFKGTDLQVTKKPDIQEIKGHQCQRFDYEYYEYDDESNKNLRYWGKVWLDNENGIPLLDEGNLESPIKMMKDITIATFYHYGEDGWYIDEVNTSFRISMLIISAYTTICRYYRNYWEFIPVDSEMQESD
ncbi:MAG: hypothetical protein RAO94_09380 [Candidatus Stygibacter australis]|nr:hypothetical protein [Candidatus Stygibacter australis]MDP8322547.1 hypothetical protein [Candidatus Stygibacter australis]